MHELRIRELVRAHNQEAQQAHEARELRTVRTLRSIGPWTDEQLARYQRVVTGVDARLAGVLARKPALMRYRSLVR